MRQTALCMIAMAFLCAFQAAPAQAQSRVFVAAQGSDANPCSFALPCRTFQRAHDVVAAGGEIDVLDPAGYGAVTITKAISVQGHGFAGIAATSGDAVTISAALTDKVSLRGVLIDGVGSGSGGNAIAFNTGLLLNVQDCVIRNFASGSAGHGILFTPNAASRLVVSNTTVADNAGSGINVAPTGSGTVTVVLDRMQIDSNSHDGVRVFGDDSTGLVKVTLSDSVVTHSGLQGIEASSSTGAPLNVWVRNSTIAYNTQTGVEANNIKAGIIVTRSTITGNGIGFAEFGGGAIASFVDNNVFANNINGSPTSTATYQ